MEIWKCPFCVCNKLKGDKVMVKIKKKEEKAVWRHG